jgi:hypothetical protein
MANIVFRTRWGWAGAGCVPMLMVALGGCGAHGDDQAVNEGPGESAPIVAANGGMFVPAEGKQLTAVTLELTEEEAAAIGATSRFIEAMEGPTLVTVLDDHGTTLANVESAEATSPAGGSLGRSTSALVVATTPVGKWIPPKINGDREYNGTPTQEPKYYLEARVFVCSTTKLCATLYMDAWENNGDRTEARGTSPAVVVWQGNGRAIRRIDSPTFDNLSGQDDNQWVGQILPGLNGLILNWFVDGDRKGDDAGVFTGVGASFQDVVIAQ